MIRRLAAAVLVAAAVSAPASDEGGAWTLDEHLEAFRLGDWHLERGVHDRAAVWYRRLAERGDPAAWHLLGITLVNAAMKAVVAAGEAALEDGVATAAEREAVERAERALGEARVEGWAWASLGAAATCDEFRAFLPGVTRLGCLDLADGAREGLAILEADMTAGQVERARALAAELAAGFSARR